MHHLNAPPNVFCGTYTMVASMPKNDTTWWFLQKPDLLKNVYCYAGCVNVSTKPYKVY